MVLRHLECFSDLLEWENLSQNVCCSQKCCYMDFSLLYDPHYWIFSSFFGFYWPKKLKYSSLNNLWRVKYLQAIIIIIIIYNYPPKARWIVVDIYPPLLTDPEGDSCFSIYQIRWIKKTFLQFLLLRLSRHFSLRSQNSEYPRIFRVKGANENARKLLSTDLVNTNY